MVTKKNKAKQAVVDEDPNGEILLKRNPLDEAKKYVGILVKYAPYRFSTWILQYDVAMRRGKKMMALQALFKARVILPHHYEFFERVVDFALNLNVKDENLSNAVVREVLESETQKLIGGKTVEEYVLEAYASIKDDDLAALPKRLAVARAMRKTKTCCIEDIVSSIVNKGLKGRDVSVANCKTVITFLDSLEGNLAEAKSTWIALVKENYPLAKDII